MKKKISSTKIEGNKTYTNEKVSEESTIKSEDGSQSYKKVIQEETVNVSPNNNKIEEDIIIENTNKDNSNQNKENINHQNQGNKTNFKERLKKLKNDNYEESKTESNEQKVFTNLNGNWFGKHVSSFREKINNFNGLENITTQKNKFTDSFKIFNGNKSNNDTNNDSNNDSKNDSKNQTKSESNSNRKSFSVPKIFDQAIDLFKETYQTEDQANNIRKKEYKENLFKIQNLDKIIEEYEENTPEWKKYALVPYQVKKSRFEKMYESVKESESVKMIHEGIKETKMQSKYSEIKEEYNLLKTNLKDEISTTQNPIIINLENKVMGQLNSEKQTDAVEQMRLFDHKFSMEYLDMQIPTIINQQMDVLNNFDDAKLEKLCAEDAQNFIRSMWKINNTNGVKPSTQQIISDYIYHDTKLSKNNEPLFKYQFQVVRPTVRYSLKDGSIVDGSENKLEEDWYIMWITKNENPDQEMFEHQYMIYKLEQIARMERLF